MKREADEETRRAVAAYEGLLRAADSIVSLLTRHLGHLGLTMGQFRTLEALRNSGPLTQAALCEWLHCGQANVFLVVRNLEKRKMVTRRPDERDRRQFLIHLTPVGEKKIEEVLPLHVGMVRAQMGALRVREQEALARICGKLGDGTAMNSALESVRSARNAE
jgi:MarR family transcriptional regulator, 2-MHQ and catechol-resistance regulon repressor